MSNAQEAFEGTKKHFQYAEWPNIEHDKLVVLKGTQRTSNYAILDSEGAMKEGSQLGINGKEIKMEAGQTLRVTECDVHFKEIPLE